MATIAKSVPVEKRTIRRANQLRTQLVSPYVFQTHWVKLSNDVEKEILASFTSIFEDLPPFVPPKMQKKEQEPRTEPTRDRDNTAVKAMRSLIVSGINQVTRGLEKRQIQAVILNRPNVPGESVLTDHLKVLSATRDVPVCVVSGLRDQLCQIMNMKQLSVVGFRNSSQCPVGFPPQTYQKLSKLIERIREVTPIVALPWKHTEADLHKKSQELIKRVFPNGDKRIVSPDTDSVGSGQKRKAEEETVAPNKKAKVGSELESPFAKERGQQTEVSKKSEDGASIGDSFKYQTANIVHIIKGEKKSKRKKKRKAKNKN